MSRLFLLPIAASFLASGCAADYPQDYGAGYPPAYDNGPNYNDPNYNGYAVQQGDLFGGQNVASVDVFYGPLAAYGDWVNSRFGRAFRPNVGPDWRPYVNGRWTEDRLWLSDDPWGWATDHYGRWGFDDRAGWVWVPGTEWAPSWVAWRDNGDVTGWAPIPPGVNFSVGIGFGAGWGYDNWNSWYAPSWVWVPRAYVYQPHFGGRVLPWNRGNDFWRGSRWQQQPNWRPGQGWHRPGGYDGGNRPGGNGYQSRPDNGSQGGGWQGRPNSNNRPGTPPADWRNRPNGDDGRGRPNGDDWRNRPNGNNPAGSAIGGSIAGQQRPGYQSDGSTAAPRPPQAGNWQPGNRQPPTDWQRPPAGNSGWQGRPNGNAAPNNNNNNNVSGAPARPEGSPSWPGSGNRNNGGAAGNGGAAFVPPRPDSGFRGAPTNTAPPVVMQPPPRMSPPPVQAAPPPPASRPERPAPPPRNEGEHRHEQPQ